MPTTAPTAIAVIGIDIGKNSFHIVQASPNIARTLWTRRTGNSSQRGPLDVPLKPPVPEPLDRFLGYEGTIGKL